VVLERDIMYALYLDKLSEVDWIFLSWDGTVWRIGAAWI